MLPVTGFPHDGGKAKEGLRATNNSDTEQHTVQLIHRKHSSMGVVSVVYHRSMRFGRNEFVVEVVDIDVLTTVVEVVVLSFIGDHRGGSGSRGSRRLVENHGGGSCTHVVIELDRTNVLEGSRGK